MLDKLQALEDRYLDLEAKISAPEVIADQTNWLKATKAHAKLEPIVTAYREYRDMIKARDEAEELLAAGDDEELVEMAKEELKELKPQIEEYEEKLTILLLPSDPIDYPAIVENPAEFELVATDAATGKPVYFTKDDMKQDDYRAIMASCALPVMCRPISFHNETYFDGGLSDSVPIERAL